MGLEILLDFLKHVETQPAIAQQIYQAFFMSILKDVLYVLTDRLHKSQFHLQTTVLKHMCYLIESQAVTSPLWDPSQEPQVQNNQQYVRMSIASILSSAFPNLSPQQIQASVLGFFNMTMDEAQYKQHVRDFLISLREFSGEDNAGLYSDEVQAQQAANAEADLARRSAVPGLVNPNEIDDDDLWMLLVQIEWFMKGIS